MKTIDKKDKTKQSIFEEILFGIFDLFIGNITSKIGWALISMLIGIVVLTRPIIDENGIELKKSVVPYIIGSALIILSIGLVILWLRKRNATNTRLEQEPESRKRKTNN